MSWTDLLNKRTVQTHATSEDEIKSLREVVARDLKDAEIIDLSADRRFAVTYNAVLQLSKMVIAGAGYRVATGGSGHHQKTFAAVVVALGGAGSALAAYFETCHRNRNNIDYDAAEIVTETEADELLLKAEEFRVSIEKWIANNHPQFKV